MSCYASTVVSLALAEVGYIEKASNSQLNSKTGNPGTANWNKYAAFIDANYPNFYNGKKNGYSWCDVFVDCMFIQAYGYENALRLTCQPEKSTGAGVGFSRDFYKVKGQLSDKPSVGAQVFFLRANTANRNDVYHTGLVVEVNGNTFTCVEGNDSSNMVGKHVYTLGKGIYQFGVPAYDKLEAADEPQTFTVELDTKKYKTLMVKLV